MTIIQDMIRTLALAARNRVGPNCAETHVISSIYVAMWDQAGYTVTVAGTEYGPYSYDDARDAIIKHIEALVRKEQRSEVPA